MRVLVVEDSAPTRELLVRSLSDAGIEVVTASRFATGLRLGTTEEFDVLILDLMLPDGDGLDLCHQLRAAGVATPILCLTARADVTERVQGLDAGADDYMKKPFALAELHARIRALARRQGQAPPARLTCGALDIEFAARRLTRSGQDIPLTAREWTVLELLVARPGRLVPRLDLLELAWGATTSAASASLDVIMARLRRKLSDSHGACPVRTVRGEGFVFELAP